VVINVAPSSFAYSSDPISGAVTLDWSTINGADGYRLSLSDGSSVQSADAYYTFDHPLDANTPMTVSVAGLVETGSVVCNGPESIPFTIALQQSRMTSAVFDGQNLSAAWAPVAGASGYRLSLQKSGAPNVEEAHFDVNADQTKGKWPFTPSDTDAVYVVGIQTVFAGNTAPISDLVNIYQPGFIPSRELASSSFPYLVPAPSMAGAFAAPTGHTIDLFLSSIGEVDAGNLPVSNGPFTFAANPDANTAPIYPYVLSMASDSAVWTFGAEPIRTELRAHYVDFLKALEDAGVVPWGLQIVQENISRYMPQTFQETLYYAFGLSFPSAVTGDTLGSCDLRPGMVLRVIAEPYQSMTQNSGLQWSNGYVGGAAVDYDVQSFIDTSGNITTGFDSFVAQLVAGGAMTVNPPPEHASTQQQGGIGDAADAYYPGFRTPFYRMFNPVTLPSPSAPCPTDTTQNFVIAAADSYADLCLTRNVPGGASPVLYFRGRTVLRPCIRVILDGEPRTVTVGTTVGNLLEQAGRNPMPAGLPLVGLKLWRSLGPVVLDPRASLSTQNSYQVRFDWMNEANYAPGWTALSLPLLAGDIVVTNAGQG
jgi:hypothetical protein